MIRAPVNVLDRAFALARYQRLVRLAAGMLVVALTVAVSHAVLLLLAGISAPMTARLGFLCVAFFAGAAAIAWAACLVLSTPPADRVAVLVERRFPQLRDRFVTAVEIGLAERNPSLRWTAANTSSPALTARLAQQAETAVRHLDLRQAIDTRPTRRLAFVVAGVALLLALSALLFPAAWAGILRPPEPPALTVTRTDEGLAPVEPITGPSIADVMLELDYPAYTKQSSETRTSDLESISAIVGTRVTISATVAGDDVSAALHVDDSTEPLAIGADRRVITRLTLSRDITWRLRATDRSASSMSTQTCRLKAVPDAAPKITLTEPGKSIAIPDPRPVRLVYRAEDDWGLTGVRLEYRAPEQTGWKTVPLTPGGGRVLADAWNWDLRPLRLIRGQTVSYRLLAIDNDTVFGPKTSRTPTYTVTIGADVSGEGVPADAEQATHREAEGLEDLEQEAEELGRRLDELISALENGKLTEQERARQAAELNEAQRRVAEQADRVSRALAESERQAERQGLAPELQEKMRELHDLLQETMNEDLAGALKEIEQALQSMDPDKLQEGLRRARQSQQSFTEQLDQAIKLLKRARLERDVARAADRAEKLAADQEQLNERREQLQPNQANQAREQADAQQRLKQREADLEGALDELSQQARDVDRQAADELSEISDRLRQSGAQQAMQEASDKLRQEDPSEAAQPQQMALNDLNQAASDLRRLQAGMTAGNQWQLSRAAQEMTRDALYLSREQERLMRSSEDLEQLTATSASQGKARREAVRRGQEALESGTRQLGEKLRRVSEQTPVIDPSLVRKAEETADLMARAAREAAGGAGPQAAQTQRNAMSRLNELAEELIRAGEQMQQAAQGMAMQQLLQQLQALAQQQRGLNQQTKQAQSQGSTPRKQGSRGDLADAQQKLREALQRLLQKAGRPSGLPDRLGGVPADMQDVEQQLRQDRLGRQTLDRQQQILHRMLDAQRSVYKKDQQRRQRIAERPKPFRLPASPPELTPRNPPQTGPSITPGEDAELPLDYEDMVRQYFRALAEVP